MCRLLVDCDDNTASLDSVEEDPEDFFIQEREGKQSQYVASQSPPGTGTVAMAKVWKNIVFIEVSKVEQKCRVSLKSIDCCLSVILSSKQVLEAVGPQSPQSVSANLVGIYDKLKQAMSELFGDHSQFAISLKDGFSKAFLHLDEIRGVRFCERLCASIDALLDCFGRDAPKFKTITENQREVMLLKLAEPLQFLHGLDIAYVFEHYYRSASRY